MPVNNPGILTYRSYQALISQAGLAPPADVVLFNDLGEISYSRNGFGAYTCDSGGLFIAAKTFILIGTPNDFSGSSPDLYVVEAKWFDVNTININAINANGFSQADNLIAFPTPFEIRVYT